MKHTKKKALILAIFLLVFGITGCSFRSNYSNTGAKPEYDFDIPYTDFMMKTAEQNYMLIRLPWILSWKKENMFGKAARLQMKA